MTEEIPDDVIDSDIDEPVRRRDAAAGEWDLLASASAGGVLGALGRYAVAETLPHRGDEFAWSTVIINATGCALIGVLMVVLLERTHPHRLIRPFLGVGILGGYTTYSTFAVDAQSLLVAHRPVVALAYVVATVVSCLLATAVAMTATRHISARADGAGADIR